MTEANRSSSPFDSEVKQENDAEQAVRQALLLVHQNLPTPEAGAILTEGTAKAKRIREDNEESLETLPLEDLYALVFTEVLSAGIDDPEEYLRQKGILE